MELIVKNLEELPAAVRKLLPVLRGRGANGGSGESGESNVVALYGGMGAGKTTLVAALVREMGSPDDVSSPTFALVNDYLVPGGGEGGGDEGTGGEAVPGGRHVYHFDFYRIDDVREAFDLGYEEYFYSGELCLVEWPEKIEELLPEQTLRLHIDTLPDGSRRITVK
jgi:tRNA threonylcarbamoyladenosine biosynthesis protein TsaE